MSFRINTFVQKEATATTQVLSSIYSLHFLFSSLALPMMSLPFAISKLGPAVPIAADRLFCNEVEVVWSMPEIATSLLDVGMDLVLYSRSNHWISCSGSISKLTNISRGWAILAINDYASKTPTWLCAPTATIAPSLLRSITWRLLRPFLSQPRSIPIPLDSDILMWMSTIKPLPDGPVKVYTRGLSLSLEEIGDISK